MYLFIVYTQTFHLIQQILTYNEESKFVSLFTAHNAILTMLSLSEMW